MKRNTDSDDFGLCSLTVSLWDCLSDKDVYVRQFESDLRVCRLGHILRAKFRPIEILSDHSKTRHYLVEKTGNAVA
jgi:hypothetical protein